MLDLSLKRFQMHANLALYVLGDNLLRLKMDPATWNAVLPADLNPLTPGNLVAIEQSRRGGLQMRHNTGFR